MFSLKFSDAVKVKANSDFFSKSSAQLVVPGDDERSSLQTVTNESWTIAEGK